MIKAVFIDFYGTVVHEDGEIIKQILQIIFDTGNVHKISDIGSYWWNEFQTSFLNAYGNNFATQRELELRSLQKTIQHFKSTANAEKLSSIMFKHLMNPPIFSEAKEFFEKCTVPIYIVSNIDNCDIRKAIEFHDLKPDGIFTSEDAKSYKPRSELFKYALKSTGLAPQQVVHIGDSLSSDIKGASSVGIKAIWINRNNRTVPKGIVSVSNLSEVYNTAELLKMGGIK